MPHFVTELYDCTSHSSLVACRVSCVAGFEPRVSRCGPLQKLSPLVFLSCFCFSSGWLRLCECGCEHCSCKLIRLFRKFFVLAAKTFRACVGLYNIPLGRSFRLCFLPRESRSTRLVAGRSYLAVHYLSNSRTQSPSHSP